MPDLQDAYNSQGSEIQFLMVNMTDGSQETLQTTLAFVQESGYTFPVYYDVNYEAAIAYGVTSLPTTYFIARDGTLVAYRMGMLTAAMLEQGIELLLK